MTHQEIADAKYNPLEWYRGMRIKETRRMFYVEALNKHFDTVDQARQGIDQFFERVRRG